MATRTAFIYGIDKLVRGQRFLTVNCFTVRICAVPPKKSAPFEEPAMNTRRRDDSGALEKLGARVRQRTMTGTEASTIGFILVAYIGVFSGLGYWLDTHFKTSWIVAVGVLLGAAVGFREMLRMAQKLTGRSISEDAQSQRSKMAQAREAIIVEAPDASAASAPAAAVRSRIFAVPPPPAASFDKSASATQAESTPAFEAESEQELDSEELIERLLKDDDLADSEKA
jgi:F0F1-type ATP synthase assembly protein I